MDTTARLEQIFNDVMKDETVPVRQRTKTNCAHWDSLAQIGLIATIEQEFGIRITDKDAVDLLSFETALDIVNERCKQKKP